MNCCAQCFGDSYLGSQIIPDISSETGTCDYCGSEGQALVEPQALKDLFEVTIGIYSRDPSGKTLSEWLSADWAMFRHPRMDLAHSKELLADILDDGEIVRQTFSPTFLGVPTSLDRWTDLRSELMHANRYFPKTTLNLERLTELLPYLLIPGADLASEWFRARIQEGAEPFGPNEMGAPPENRASHGRANPAGIPYLYLASTAATAVSELRPHTGEVATVASVSLAPNLKIVDLRAPRETVSPFMLADENEVALLRGDIDFLVHLGTELTRPVLPKAAAIDYIPSQYLCEYVKRCGFDGVMYRSSVSDGVNLALFNPDTATIGDLTQRRVTRVSVEIEERA